MGKVFEDYFSEIQTDMIAVCLEYVDNNSDDIYIYCSYEPEMYSFDVFYRINEKLVYKYQVNDAVVIVNGKPEYVYDISDNRQFGVLDIGNENLQKIHQKCKGFDREMPTEMKLHYDVSNNKLEAKYRYDLVYSSDEALLPDDIFERWFEEVSGN
ncbi:DUF600 domain-containing protein [Metabacillus herbersteinensis]|uniref:DUF600 domain-containing protein n=1 Tax=Metabacillus herbersteinensis TaxID=283816 RepID=A0ABV6GDP5_9BACI